MRRRVLIVVGVLALAAAAVAIWVVYRAEPAAPVAAQESPGGDGGPSTRGRANAFAPPRAAPPHASSRAPASAEALLDEARSAVQTRPDVALRLLELSEAREPGAEHADERSFLKMQALVNLGQIAAARDEAASFFQRFPGSPFGAQAAQLTGVHPRPPVGPRK